MKKETNKNNNDNNNNPFKQFNFKFNFYWIYGIIFALIIGFQLFNSTELSSNKLSQNEFTTILNENDIDNIVIVNADYAQITIKSGSLSKEKYKRKQTNSFLNITALALGMTFFIEKYFSTKPIPETTKLFFQILGSNSFV